MTLPAAPGRCPQLPAKAAFSVPNPPETPRCPGIPAVNCTPGRVGALRSELSDTGVDSFENESEDCKTTTQTEEQQGRAGQRRVSQGFSNLKVHANHRAIWLTVLSAAAGVVRPRRPIPLPTSPAVMQCRPQQAWGPRFEQGGCEIVRAKQQHRGRKTTTKESWAESPPSLWGVDLQGRIRLSRRNALILEFCHSFSTPHWIRTGSLYSHFTAVEAALTK